jgi:Zn-dependent peptidase ImmA (M78 family)
MGSDAKTLRRELRQAGLTARAIDAVWPEWWSDDAGDSRSATAELRYTLARRLGLSPRSLFEGAPRFIWRDEAKYKNLGSATDEEVGILTSFGVAVGQCAMSASSSEYQAPNDAQFVRQAVLETSMVVGLADILAYCWGIGIPVLQLRLFPLARKRMHGMTVRVGGRFVILVGLETRFLAQAAFLIAHEIGHIVFRHVSESVALVDVEDPYDSGHSDDEETLATRYALELLTGSPEPTIEASVESFSARQLAVAAMGQAATERIDAGALALGLAHATGRWAQGFGALKLIPPGSVDVGEAINQVARHQLNWAQMSHESHSYLEKVLGFGSS